MYCMYYLYYTYHMYSVHACGISILVVRLSMVVRRFWVPIRGTNTQEGQKPMAEINIISPAAPCRGSLLLLVWAFRPKNIQRTSWSAVWGWMATNVQGGQKLSVFCGVTLAAQGKHV